MDKTEMLDLCNNCLAQLKNKGRKFHPIKFKIHNKKSPNKLGSCCYSYKRTGYDTIEINVYIENIELAKTTILHELAHADLEARGNGHRSIWKRVAKMYSAWFNVHITTLASADQRLHVPGTYKLYIVWKDDAVRRFRIRNKKWTKFYANRGSANNFVKKNNQHIESWELEKVK